jgi:nicotinamide-nucleotide amidase
MRVEIVSIGEEIRLGEIADTNASEMASALAASGGEVARVTVTGDRRDEIAAVFKEAIARSEVVIATGGLGPTEDDLTREALADALGVGLERRPEAERAISERVGRPLAGPDLRQARAPEGVTLIENRRGTAPGLRASRGGKTVYVLPGVPHEMRGMFEEVVLPEVKSKLAGPAPVRRHLVSHGLPEAEIASRLEGLAPEGGGLEIGTRAKAGVITIRLTARAENPAEAERIAEEAAREVTDRLGGAVVGEGDLTLAELVLKAALGKNWKIALAESSTGGLIASKLVGVPGASAALVEGVVAYSNQSKVRRLGVPEALVAEKGAVSAEVACAMAEGARREAGADLSVAVTGVAGPGGGTEAKPVGLTYLASASRLGTEVVERRFRGERAAVRERAAEAALGLLLRAARRLEEGGAARPAGGAKTCATA